MTNLEELDKLNDALLESENLLKENAGLIDPNTANLISLKLVIVTYLSSISKSLAIIADKMSEKEKDKEKNDG